jgi:hypothetical protein
MASAVWRLAESKYGAKAAHRRHRQRGGSIWRIVK